MTAKYIAALTIFMFTLITAGTVFADTIPPHISIEGIDDHFQPGVIKAQVNDDTAVAEVWLYYRKPGEIDYNSIEMKRSQDIYYRELKSEFGIEGAVEYYILARDTSGNEATQPIFDPEESPLVTTMDDMANQSAEEVVLSSPEPGTLVLNGSEMIIISFYRTDRTVDMKTVRIRIDDRDRTREADIVDNIVMWEPRRPLRDGTHVVEIYARDTDGNVVGPNIWSFRVKTRLELPLGVTGDFYMGLQRDDRSDGADYVPLWNNKIDFALQGERDGISWEMGALMSSEESGFLTTEDIPDRQPINRYYFTARTHHWRVHVGDSNPTLSELSMKGVLVRGFNAQFKSNRLNSQIVYGHNRRSIDERIEIIEGISNVTPSGYTLDDGTYVDISSKPYQEIVQEDNGEYRVYEFTPGAFKRNVLAFDATVTPVQNRHATWDFGFNFFSAEDDSTSLPDTYDPLTKGRYYDYSGDAQFLTGYAPKKNWVGTFETSLAFNRNRSKITAEFGGTIATENMYGIVTDEIRDEIPDNIDDDVFRFNGSTQTSFDKMKLDKSISSGLKDALFSVYRVRFISQVPIPRTRTTMRAETYRIPTHYVSLGNPHQRTDMGGYKINLRTAVIQDQLSLSMEYDTYDDNLDKERTQYANDDGSLNSDLTRETDVMSVSATYRPRQFADYAPRFTMGYRIYNAENNLDLRYNDAYQKIDTASNTLLLSLGGELPVGLHRHRGTVSVTNMSISDDRPIPDYDRNDSNNLTVLLNLNSTFDPMPLSILLSLGRTANETHYRSDDNANPTRATIDTGINMANASATWKWFRDRRFKTTLGFGYIGSGNDETGMYEVDSTKASIRISADYKLSRTSTLGGMVRYISFTDNVDSSRDYTEPIVGIDIRANF